jgi:PAS domain S-box-containing protein
MPAKLLVTSIVTAFNLGLALLVYLKDPSRWVNRAFGVFALTVAGWTVGTYLGSTYAGTPAGLLVGRGAFAMAGLAVYALLVFLRIFPEGSTLPRSYTVIIFGTLAVTSALIAVTTPWIVATQTLDTGTLKVQYGLFYPFFALYIFACVGYSFFTILRNIHLARGVARLQLKYLFLGLLVPVVLATITNLLIPLVFGTSQFSHYGPLFSFLMIAMIAHAIVRQRLMNIRLVVRRGVVLLLAVAIAGGIFVGLLGLTTAFVLPRHRDLPLWAEVSLVLLIAILFQPLRRRINASIDRYLYREPYDYQRTIREASRTIGSMLDLKSLLHYVGEVIGRTVRPEAVSTYIKNPERPSYAQMAAQRFLEDNGRPLFRETLPESSPLIRFLSHARTYLLRDDLRRTKPEAGRSDALKELLDLGGEMALPILHEGELTGFLIVAPKLSGDPYFSEDIDLLSTLVGQAAIAIKNAQLYREVALVNEYVTNIVATMESGVITVDADGKVTLFNPAAERITGLPAKAILSGPASGLPSALAHPLQATLADGQAKVQTDTTIPDSGGYYRPVSSSTYALRDRLGNVLGAVAVFSDLTRLKELEGEKRRAERLASIGALTSGIAHEIKNPLVAIKTFAELLPERFTEKDFREDFSQVVIREIARIDDLVARLRGLAAPSTQPLPSLDLRLPIEETLVLLRGQLEQKRIRVRRLYERALPQVAGDPAQLKQLFLNLLMNALEAMQPGGELTIQLANGEGVGVPFLVARVSDTGSGIPHEMLGNVFDPFVTTKPRGSGLGLAICRGIADAHRATIRVENNTHTPGTTVTIEFTVTEELPAIIRT